jgi:hypothetical protein
VLSQFNGIDILTDLHFSAEYGYLNLIIERQIKMVHSIPMKKTNLKAQTLPYNSQKGSGDSYI